MLLHELTISTQLRFGVSLSPLLQLLSLAAGANTIADDRFSDAVTDFVVNWSCAVLLATNVQTAMDGFEHSQWSVRNSCMMVFSALITRAVSNQKNSDIGDR
jgi:hypothetical protein